MKIAFITPEYITEANFDGGLANYLFQISRALLSEGHEPIIFVGTDKNEALINNGIKIIRVKVRNAFLSVLRKYSKGGLYQVIYCILQSWSLNKKLKQFHILERIDIAHFTSHTATALFRPKNIPSVIRISSFQPIYDSAYEKPRNLTRRVLHYLEKNALLKANRLICPSFIIANIVKNYTGMEVEIVESPFSSEFADLDYHIYYEMLNGKEYFLFFGSIGLLKGVKTIADSLPFFFEKHKDIFFVFVGKNMQYHENTMMDYVFNRAGIYRSRVIHIEPIPHRQLYPIIKNALAVVLPSIIDNFPNSCLEAMAHGKIVVGTRGASFEQIIEDGKSGFLCEIDNTSHLLKVIDQILNLTPIEKQAIGLHAKKRIIDVSPEIVVKKLLKLYEETI